MATATTSDTIISATQTGRVCICEHCPERPYAELTIPDDFGTVRYVQFKILSHDQGWCDDPQGSYSWFDVLLRRDHARNDLRSLTVCENRIGNPEMYEQVIHWSADDDTDQADELDQTDRKIWLQSLVPGDTIELYARAVYRGWANIVYEVHIELGYDRSLTQEHKTKWFKSLFARNSHLYTRPLSTESKEIRVLKIQPGVHHDPIVCHFDYMSLAEEVPKGPSFDALSYAWDSPEDLKVVGLVSAGSHCPDVQNLYITPVAESAIRRLRHPSRPTNLWIDAVCINQNDNGEKAQQVRNMASIYAKAETVRVWLGEQQHLEVLLQAIRDVCNINHSLCVGGASCTCQGTSHTSVSDLEESLSDKLRHNRGIGAVVGYHSKAYEQNYFSFMSRLFELPWFRRSWVLREVMVAQRTVVHCASRAIMWEELLQVHSWLMEPSIVNEQPQNVHRYENMPPIWSKLTSMKQGDPVCSMYLPAQNNLPKPMGILYLYLMSLDMKSTERRDKIFSLLSMSKETANDKHLPQALQPSYSKTEEEVFADFTKWWIWQNQSLSILSSVHADRRRSWVRMVSDGTMPIPLPRPSWTVPTEGSPRRVRPTLDNAFDFRATSDTTVDISLLQNELHDDAKGPPVLRLRGYQIATVAKLTYLSVDAHQTEAALWTGSTIYQVYDKIIDPNNRYHHWRVRMSESEGDFEFDALKPHEQISDHICAHWNNDDRPVRKTVDVDCVDIIQEHKDWIPPCLDPFAFVTSNGMVGLCPWTAREDDVVALLLGGKVPFLLREVTDKLAREHNHIVISARHFELVGEFYVEGIMDGKFMDNLKSREIESEIFSLI